MKTNIFEGMETDNVRLFTFNIEDSQKLREERAIVHYITTDTKDWGGDIIVQDGMDVKNFEKYRTVFYNHNYDRPVASNMWLKRDEKGWLAKTRFSEKNAFANDIYNLYLEDIIKTWSVGIQLSEGSMRFDKATDTMYIDKSTLFEYSSAPLAANFDAIDQAKSLIKSVEGLKALEEMHYIREIKEALSVLDNEFKALKEYCESLKSDIDSQDKEMLMLAGEINNMNTKSIQVVETIGRPDFKKLAKEIVAGVVSEKTGRKIK